MLSDATGGRGQGSLCRRLNALSSIVCFLTLNKALRVVSFYEGLNALSSIVCFLTERGGGYSQEADRRVSMPSRALYAF